MFCAYVKAGPGMTLESQTQNISVSHIHAAFLYLQSVKNSDFARMLTSSDLHVLGDQDKRQADN